MIAACASIYLVSVLIKRYKHFNVHFSSSMLRIMTSLCVSFVRMSSKPLFEDYCYVNEDRLYNTE